MFHTGHTHSLDQIRSSSLSGVGCTDLRIDMSNNSDCIPICFNSTKDNHPYIALIRKYFDMFCVVLKKSVANPHP